MKYVLRYVMASNGDLDQVRALFAQHRQHWESFRKEGTLLAIGPMADPRDGALAVFTSRPAAETFARSDPFVTSGVVGSWEVLEWQEAIWESPGGRAPG